MSDATDALADLRKMHDQMSRDYEADVRRLSADLAAAQAVIEQAAKTQRAIHTAWVNSHDAWLKALILEQSSRFDEIAQSSSSALAAHDAEVWDEGFEKGAASEWGVEDNEINPPNPYRQEMTR